MSSCEAKRSASDRPANVLCIVGGLDSGTRARLAAAGAIAARRLDRGAPARVVAAYVQYVPAVCSPEASWAASGVDRRYLSVREGIEALAARAYPREGIRTQFEGCAGTLLAAIIALTAEWNSDVVVCPESRSLGRLEARRVRRVFAATKAIVVHIGPAGESSLPASNGIG